MISDDEIAKEIDIDGSILYITYTVTMVLPSIDDLLDWRNSLDKMKLDNKYPVSWYDREIRATDFLLKKHNI